MNRIGLKINGIWCVLPKDVSISIEEQNPLFSDSGSFSYPIEMSVSQNRELFKSIDSPHGRIRPQDLDGLPFELWYDGVMLLYGSTETDEDLDIEEDKCSINLVSGNGDFQSKIDGMQCTDVPLMSDIKIGHCYPEVEYYTESYFGESITRRAYMDEQATMVFENINVSESYKSKFPYCNVRICVEKEEDYIIGQEEPYWVLDANRPWSGICFYVAYFLDCLFAHLGVVVKENNIGKVEDMLRLAFFTTKCDVEYKNEELIDKSIIQDGNVHFEVYTHLNSDGSYNWPFDFKILRKEAYATNKNFPQVDVKDVVESLFNAFGLKIISDAETNQVSLVYVRDILRDNEIIDIPMLVRNQSVSYNKLLGVTLTYDGDEKDTAFVYDDWKDPVPFTDYRDVILGVGPYNKSCYISKITGDKYRVKNNSEAEEEGNEAELYPTLFEVAQYNDFVLGEKSDNNEELVIKFTPLIEQAVSGDADEKLIDINPQRLAVFIPDIKLKKPQTEMGKAYNIGGYVESVRYDRPTEDGSVDSVEYDIAIYLMFKAQKYINYDASQYKEPPLQEHDSGFTLGIMRGPGSEAGTEVFLENYDGNGNDAWTTVVADYAFTADTMDAYGNRYDYNGTAEGGIADQQNSISLKTHIQTAQDLGLKDKDGNDIDWGIDATAAKRGLADRFMSEYMYFLLHRKTVTMEVDTTLSHLTSLSWFKQLRISDTVGRLKSRSYTLTNSGVTDMSIELYTIN